MKMKAIRARYYGATNTKPSKVVACDADGNKFAVSVSSHDSTEAAQDAAVKGLQAKMNWPGVMISGGFDNDDYYVFVPKVGRKVFTKEAGNTICIDGKTVCYSSLLRVDSKGEINDNGRYAIAPWEHDELIARCVELLNIHGFEPKL
jgi:hypothetical protein